MHAVFNREYIYLWLGYHARYQVSPLINTELVLHGYFNRTCFSVIMILICSCEILLC